MSDYWPEIEIARRVLTLPLFAAYARRADPMTSHAAGDTAHRSGIVAKHERLIVEALQAGPASKCEIARRCGLSEQQVNRRLAAMRRSGAIERTGRAGRSDSGHAEAEYRAAPRE